MSRAPQSAAMLASQGLSPQIRCPPRRSWNLAKRFDFCPCTPLPSIALCPSLHLFLAGFHCCFECLVLIVAFGWPVPHLPLRAVASTASDCVVSARPASFRIAVAPSSSLAVGFGFHLSSSPVCVASVVSFASDVCILSGLGIKVNRFSGKDQEVFTKVKNPAVPGLGVFLLRFFWLAG